MISRATSGSGLASVIPGMQLTPFVSGLLSQLFSATGLAQGTANTSEGFAYLHDNEAVIPKGDRSRSLALMEQSGLATLARSTGSSGGSSGGGAAIVVNFFGPVADELVASRVIDRIAKEARKRGFAASRGI